MEKEGHSHHFVNRYKGLVGFGLDRETDEKSLMVYLQKFSDDRFLEIFVPRLSDQEIEEILDLIHRLLKRHLKEEEYHVLFLKEEDEEERCNTEEDSLSFAPLPGEDQIRWLCSKRGLDWDRLTEAEKEEFLIDITRV
jgi:hypothetical protein